MNSATPDCRSDCPISLALEVLGDKWSLILIRDMVFRGKSRYSEFLASEEGISTNILASRLASLESAGVIERVPAAGSGRRQAYALSPKGQELRPVLEVLAQWSLRHHPGAKLSADVLRRLPKATTSAPD